VETLLVSGTLDMVTPAQVAAREVLPFLRHGRQIILPGKSHRDLFLEQPEALRTLAVSFFETGRADDSGFANAPQRLGNGLRLPTLVKLVLVGLVLGTSGVNQRRTGPSCCPGRHRAIHKMRLG
jgi:hypothetical protein